MAIRVNPTAMAIWLAAVMTSAVSPAGAGPMDDLKQVLERLSATTPVAGPLTVEVTSRSDGEDGSGGRSGSASVHVGARPDGVTVRVPAEILAASRNDRGGSEGEAPPSPAAALREVTAPLVDQLLDAAAALRRTLEHASFERQRTLTGGEAGSRELIFRIDPPMSERERKRFRELDLTLALTVNGDGVPVAARQVTRLKGRVLLASFEFNSSEENRFALIGDRLVTVRSQREERGSGMGQRNESRKVFTFGVETSAVFP